MKTVKAMNDTFAFLLELCMLAAYVFSGFHLDMNIIFRLLIGVGAPVIVIILWSIFAAPRSESRLRQPWLALFKLVVFSGACTALVFAHSNGLAIALIAAFLINTALDFLPSH